MRSLYAAVLVILSLLNTYPPTEAAPIPSVCYTCPTKDKLGEDNYIQEKHRGGLVCYYTSMTNACVYDPSTGVPSTYLPDICPNRAQRVSCITVQREAALRDRKRPQLPEKGNIWGVMKEKTGNALSDEERARQAKVLVEQLAQDGKR